MSESPIDPPSAHSAVRGEAWSREAGECKETQKLLHKSKQLGSSFQGER